MFFEVCCHLRLKVADRKEIMEDDYSNKDNTNKRFCTTHVHIAAEYTIDVHNLTLIK